MKGRVRAVLVRPIVRHFVAFVIAMGLLIAWPQSVSAAYASAAVICTSSTWMLTRNHYRKQLRELQGQLYWAEAQAGHWEKTAQNYRKAYRK